MTRYVTVIFALFLSTTFANARPVEDLSAVFPEIEGCTRKVGSLMRDGSSFTQDAIYEPAGVKELAGALSHNRCGSITLRSAPGIKRAREANWYEYFPTQKLKVQGYDAWRNSPLCGNDPSLGSIEVYFSDDAVLIVNANFDHTTILDFAKTADYESIGRLLRTLRSGRR